MSGQHQSRTTDRAMPLGPDEDRLSEATDALRAAIRSRPHAPSVAQVVLVLVHACLLVSSLWVYGLRGGLALALLMSILTPLVALLGCIPVAGSILYWLATTRWVLPQVVSSCPGVQPTWVTTAYLAFGLALSIYYSAIVVRGFVAGYRGRVADLASRDGG